MNPLPDESPPYPVRQDGAQKSIMNHDVSRIIGALLVLAGFTAHQLGWVGARSIPYLLVNVLGSALLGWLAWTGQDWGFLLLEGVWAVVSAVSLITVLRPLGGPSRRRRLAARRPGARSPATRSE
jgi:hypothetical protein